MEAGWKSRMNAFIPFTHDGGPQLHHLRLTQVSLRSFKLPFNFIQKAKYCRLHYLISIAV